MSDVIESIADLEKRLRGLLKGEFSSLTIGFNDDPAPNYMSVGDAVRDMAHLDDADWVSPEEREAAVAQNSLWSIQWYPDTPVGFHRLQASSLAALIAALPND